MEKQVHKKTDQQTLEETQKMAYIKRAGGLISRRGASKIIDRIEVVPEIDIERALNNAIASTEMEGFEISEKDRELLLKLLKKELGLDEVIEIKNKEFKNG